MHSSIRNLQTDDASSFEMTDLFIDVYSLPDDGYGFFQLLFLTLVYGFILFTAANLISDGSEFLLLIPSISGMVGSIVLPVLGAVPDAAIVVFSGLGSDAQYQLEVGMGALAGSTILLLTIPWALVIIAGRVDISDEGKCNYKFPKLNPPDRFSLFNTGVIVTPQSKTAAIMMICTAISYVIVESAALQYRDSTNLASDEKSYVIAAFAVAILLFVAYLAYSYFDSQSETKSRDEYLVQGLIEGKLTMMAVVTGVVEDGTSKPEDSESSTLVSKDSETVKRLKEILKPSFRKYDRNNSNSLDMEELGALLKDLGETLGPSQLKKYFISADLDKNGLVDFDEYVEFCINYSKNYNEIYKEATQHKINGDNEEPKKDDDEEDGEEIPEDLIALPYAEQQRSILFRAVWRMLLGTILVVFFSDPMVDCLTAIGDRIGVRPFYIAFVLAPLASNASEIVASYKYAMKKTSSSVGISMAALLGAAIMNNTLVFGVMMIVIFVQNLYYMYFAETLAILIVEAAVATYVIVKNNHLVLDAFVLISFYPISIVIVYFLYEIGLG